MKGFDFSDFLKEGFSEEQVSILKKYENTVKNEISSSNNMKLDDILNEIKSVSTKDKYVVKINEAEDDTEEVDTEDENLDDTEDENLDDTEEVDTEDENLDDTEEDENLDDTEEVDTEDENLDDTEEVDTEDENLDDTEEVDMEDEELDDTEEIDMEDEELDDLEDDLESDEENEAEDFDDMSQENIGYSKGVMQGSYAKGFNDGYALAFQEKELWDTITNENKELILKAKNRILKEEKQITSKKSNLFTPTKEVKPVVENKKVKQEVKPVVENKKVKQEVKPVVENKKVEYKLTDEEQVIANLFESIDIPKTLTLDPISPTQRMEESLKIEEERKEIMVEKYLMGLSPLRQAELKPMLREMASKSKTTKELSELMSTIPRENVVVNNSSMNESIEKTKDIYNSGSLEDEIQKYSINLFNTFKKF